MKDNFDNIVAPSYPSWPFDRKNLFIRLWEIKEDIHLRYYLNLITILIFRRIVDKDDVSKIDNANISTYKIVASGIWVPTTLLHTKVKY